MGELNFRKMYIEGDPEVIQEFIELAKKKLCASPKRGIHVIDISPDMKIIYESEN